MYLVVKRESKGLGVLESTNLKLFRYFEDAKEFIDYIAVKDLEDRFNRNDNEFGNELYRLMFIPESTQTEYVIQRFEAEEYPEER